MDAALFAQMMTDKSVLNLKKMQYKYSAQDVEEMLQLFRSGMYITLPLRDFAGNPLVILPGAVSVPAQAVKSLARDKSAGTLFSGNAMTEEIYSTLKIENIHSTRESIRKIINGQSPANDEEAKIQGMKAGLEFIANPANAITEENLHTLYQLAVGNSLPEEERLHPGTLYRHGAVFVVGDKVEHEGLPADKLPEYMRAFFAFINEESPLDDLTKAAVIHFYLAYLHPYFDGNGRTARMLHLWYLVQRGFPSALFTPLSGYIRETKSDYYKAFQLIEDNALISRQTDVTPFAVFFAEKIYAGLSFAQPAEAVKERFAAEQKNGKITPKEAELWNYVLSAYGTSEFSTKQLERDYGRAAYATIRSFAIKFTELGLLAKADYGARPKYRLAE